MLRLPPPQERARSGDAEIRDEILGLNLRRLFRLALILAPVHLAHVVLFWQYTAATGPASEAWRGGIMTAHGLMTPVAVALGVVCSAPGRARMPARLLALVPGTVAMIYLLFGAALSVIDQLVTSSITPVLLAAVGVAGAVLMPPLAAAVSFSVLLIAFWTLIAWTQTDPDILLSQRVNSMTLAGAGFGISYLLWHNQVLTLRQRKEIEAQKLALEEKRLALEEKNEALALLVNQDPLTGLSNRTHFDSAGAAEVARLRRGGRTASLVLLDIDAFKSINDEHGHPAGDAVLKQIARVLESGVRDVDTLARLGGEEFAILLPDTEPGAAVAMAERLRAAIEEKRFIAGGAELELTASFGVAALTPADPDPLNAAYRAADRLLYQAKDGGRNRVCVDYPASAK